MSKKTYTSNLANGDPLDNNKQLVITRANMTTDFTDDEFQACSDAMSDGFSVVVHFSSSGLNEAALTKIGTDGALVFTVNNVNGQLVAYKVAPGATHSITTYTFDLSPFYHVNTSTDTRDTIQTAFDAGLVPIIVKTNPAGQRQIFYFTDGAPTAGYLFAHTDSNGTSGWAIDQYDTWSQF